MKVSRWLSLPALLWMTFFLLGPLILVLALSFAKRGTYGGVEWIFQLTSYDRVVSLTYLRIFGKSLWLAFTTAFVCVSLGLLCAWFLATSAPQRRLTWVGLIALPFLTNLVIRVYAIKYFVGIHGPLQAFLQTLGISYDPFILTANPVLVWCGLLSAYLPFAILPLYGAFEKFDFQLLEAAQDLGASSFHQLTRVVIPTMKLPVLGSFVLVFIPCMGEYLIPDLLGGARTMLWGNLITDKFLKARDWPMGAALAVTMLAFFALFWVVRLVLRKERD